MRVMEEEKVRVVMVGRRSPYERVASGNAVVVFGLTLEWLLHVPRREAVVAGLGVGPTVSEIDQERGGREIHAVLAQLLSSSPSSSSSSSVQPNAAVPAVFVGGKLLGGVEKVMSVGYVTLQNIITELKTEKTI